MWQDWGKFTEADVHHQYAIALKTPAYRNVNIEENVKVYIQLYRPNDNAISEPVEFRYKPSYSASSNRKRPRVTSYESSDIPLVITERNKYVPYIQTPSNNSCNSQSDSDCDLDQILSDLFRNYPLSDPLLNSEGIISTSSITLLQIF